jgi:histidyl-tRNA synthetase
MERLLTALEYEKINLEEDKGVDVYIIPMSEKEKVYALGLLQDLRMNGFNCDMDYMNRNIKGNFKQSERLDAKYVVIIGEEEITNDLLTIKDNKTKEEYKIDGCYIINFLDEKLGETHE